MISIEVTITEDYDGLISHYHVADNYLDSIITVKLIVTVRQMTRVKNPKPLEKRENNRNNCSKKKQTKKLISSTYGCNHGYCATGCHGYHLRAFSQVFPIRLHFY